MRNEDQRIYRNSFCKISKFGKSAHRIICPGWSNYFLHFPKSTMLLENTIQRQFLLRGVAAVAIIVGCPSNFSAPVFLQANLDFGIKQDTECVKEVILCFLLAGNPMGHGHGKSEASCWLSKIPIRCRCLQDFIPPTHTQSHTRPHSQDGSRQGPNVSSPRQMQLCLPL